MTGKTERLRWLQQTYEKAKAKSPERKEKFLTSSGVERPVIDEPPDAELGFPGEYPFTRGVQSTMFRSRFWTMRRLAQMILCALAFAGVGLMRWPLAAVVASLAPFAIALTWFTDR